MQDKKKNTARKLSPLLDLFFVFFHLNANEYTDWKKNIEVEAVIVTNWAAGGKNTCKRAESENASDSC